MSDSDWEVLSSEDEPKPFSQSRPSDPAASSSFPDHGDAPPQRAAPRIDRRTILKPLCLTLNQTGTRLGVGHTKGFLVFRVVATPDAQQGGGTTSPLQSKGQLALDPQYNVDLLTFSHVRERMRQQQQAAAAAAAAARAAAAPPSGSPPAHASAAPSRAGARATSNSVDRAGSPASDETARQQQRSALRCSERTKDDVEPVEGPLLDTDDLGSFLNAAGRVFAQMRRDDARGDADGRATTLAEQPRPTTERPPDSVTVNATAAVTTTVAATAAAAAAVSAEEPPSALHQNAATRLAEPSSTLRHHYDPDAVPMEPSAVLEWEEDVEIDAGDSDGSMHDAFLSDVGDRAWRPPTGHRQPHGVQDGRIDSPAAGNRAAGAPSLRGEEEEESDFVGFDAGGVSVLSFLYEQTWLALVGGGPTPMGPPNRVYFVRDGERQHFLTVPHPVVRLFLDARLLFVVTTAELRVYTNPLERGWVRLRQVLSMSASLARRYATVPLAVCAVGNAAAAGAAASTVAEVGVWSSADPGCREAVTGVEKESGMCQLEGAAANSSAGVAIPSIPVAVDYARSLVLLPTGDQFTGFALYRYMTGPEPAERTAEELAGLTQSSVADHQNKNRNDKDSSGRDGFSATSRPAAAPTAASGRTTAYLQLIASQPEAHKNPLHNLALYVGWPADRTRLLATAADEKGEPSTDASAACRSASLPAVSSSSLSDGGAGVRGSTERGSGAVTLVAASSEYATRITLWLMQDKQDTENADSAASSTPHVDPSKQSGRLPGLAGSQGLEASGEQRFVLLREFRVGLRLAAPRVVMAALPGVSRLVARVQPGHSKAATSTHSSASSTVPSHVPSQAYLATDAHRRGDDDYEGAAPPHTATVRGNSPPSPLCASSASGGTLASWAAEAASVVSASTAPSPAVHHLQFCGNGAFLLCLHGTSTISVFSTSGRESAMDAKDVTRDRAAADQNRYSRLAVMKEYLPSALSTRLEAYTRQAWSSCTGQLPTHDVTFVPRWLYLRQQDAAASAQRGPTPLTNAEAAAAAEPAPVAPQGGRRFFSRLSALVGSRSQPPASAAASPSVSAERGGAAAASVGEGEREGDAAAAPHTPLAGSPSRTLHGFSSHEAPAGGDAAWACKGGVGGWGTPLSELPECVAMWSSAAHTGHSRGGGSRPSMVLNLATCEGAFANVVLAVDTGDVSVSSVVPYAAE